MYKWKFCKGNIFFKNLKELYTETHYFLCKIDIFGDIRELNEAKIFFQICDLQNLKYYNVKNVFNTISNKHILVKKRLIYRLYVNK